jgi:hypothetical protein
MIRYFNEGNESFLAIATWQMEMKDEQQGIKHRCISMIAERKERENGEDPIQRMQTLEAFKHKLLKHGWAASTIHSLLKERTLQIGSYFFLLEE